MEPKEPPEVEPAPPVTDEWGLPAATTHLDQPVDPELGVTACDDPEGLMRWLHGAAFIGCHLIRIMSAWIPRALYFPLVHDPLEPRLRQWCECRPGCWCGTLPRRVYNATPAGVRLVLLIVAFPWGRRRICR